MLKCVNVSHVKTSTFSGDKHPKKHSKKQPKKISYPKQDFKLNEQLLNDIMGVLINKQHGKVPSRHFDPTLYSSLSSADFFASIFAYVKCCVLAYIKDFNFSGPSSVAIDNKIEQALDLVKSHLMFAVREEVEVLKEQIKELVERNNQLEVENKILKDEASPETLEKLQLELQKQQTIEQQTTQTNEQQMKQHSKPQQQQPKQQE